LTWAQFAAGAANVSSEAPNPAGGMVASSVPLVANPKTIQNAAGDSVSVGANGVYTVKFASPAWTFVGNLAQNVTDVASDSGTDQLGDYAEITFKYKAAVGYAAGIRLYMDASKVIFSDTTQAEGPNDLAFPQFVSYPAAQSHLSFGGIFCTYNFRTLYDDSLWMFYEKNHDAFILSAANNFTISRMFMKDNALACGVQADIKQLPAGYNSRFILAAQNGINKLYSTWGNTLVTLGGKKPPANDAAIELNQIGYWTDNGSTYSYNDNRPLGFQKTLLTMRDEFKTKGIDLGYVQLDSWFYPKGPTQTWNNRDGGIYEFKAHPQLFPDGLEAFHKELGLPMIAHARWVDPASPYHQQYQTSAAAGTPGAVIDKKYFDDRMAYLKNNGVTVYEQDWLGFRGQPAMNLTDNLAYLDNMANTAATNGMTMQYCMIHGRHYLQASLYPNLTSVRTSQDRFNTNRWSEFLYGSRVAQAVGTWPWTDVYMSGETRNLLISTLSAGLVGVGDKLGDLNAVNLLKAVRPDGVIVKPDVPLTPMDDVYFNDANRLGQPFIATTYTDHGKSRAVYVFAYGENPANLAATFKPADCDMAGDVYVYDYFAATGAVVKAGNAYQFTTTMPQNTTGGTYLIAVPIGPSGLALVGDTDKFVTRGKKRIASLSDDGVMHVGVAFAEKEATVTLNGYAPAKPNAQAGAGTVGDVAYDEATHVFTLTAAPDKAGTATINLTPAK
jgi:hypothetical protein